MEEAGDRLRKEPELLSPKAIETLESLPFYQERKAQWLAEAEAEARAAKAKVEAMKLAGISRMDLVGCFFAKGDKPSRAALARIQASTDLVELGEWLDRAIQGETAAQIFGT